MAKLLVSYDEAAIRSRRAAQQGGGLAAAEEQQMSFHAVAGSRLRRVTGLVNSAQFVDAIRIVMVVSEPSRAIALFFQ
eukprot:7700971-Pyramimonas_sp.AAC.1